MTAPFQKGGTIWHMKVMLQTYSGVGRTLTAAGWHSIETYVLWGGLRWRDGNNKQRLQNKI